jgi:hypothetical protein
MQVKRTVKLVTEQDVMWVPFQSQSECFLSPPDFRVSIAKPYSWSNDANAIVYSQGKDSGVEGFPLRQWSIEIYLLNEHGEQIPATLFDKVTYTLHPSFGSRAVQSTFPVLPLVPGKRFDMRPESDDLLSRH